jgi:Phage tail protein
VPLYNDFQFNTGNYNGGAEIAVGYSTDAVVFENFSLSDGTNVILTSLLDSGPTTDLVGGSVPRGDGTYVTGRYFRERTIEAQGYVKQTTAADLDAFLDTVRKDLSKQEGNLDLTDKNGTVKRFIATCVNYEELFAGRKSYHTTLCPFTARFVCRTPFGKSRSYASYGATGVTTTQTNALTNAGTYKTPLVVYLVFTAANTVTVVTLTNNTTGESLTYTGTIAANDVLAFDSDNKTVLKNGTAVEYSGAFPSLTPGQNLVQTSCTATSYTVDCTFLWKPAYL